MHPPWLHPLSLFFFPLPHPQTFAFKQRFQELHDSETTHALLTARATLRKWALAEGNGLKFSEDEMSGINTWGRLWGQSVKSLMSHNLFRESHIHLFLDINTSYESTKQQEWQIIHFLRTCVWNKVRKVNLDFKKHVPASPALWPRKTVKQKRKVSKSLVTFSHFDPERKV